ncbi:MAG: PspA/IM30 family protein [Roseinatronobacter sp.]
MIGTLRTLFAGANARAEEQLRDSFALDLIAQKIREGEAGLNAAKSTLAALVQRQRMEQGQLDALDVRIRDMTARIAQAITQARMDLAQPAAEALARMENEAESRRKLLEKLDAKVHRLRMAVESAHRRLQDLRLGQVQARAIRHERSATARLRATGLSPLDEAEDLIARVTAEEDPIERSEILAEINRDLSDDTLSARMSDAGIGTPTRVTAAAILARFAQ